MPHERSPGKPTTRRYCEAEKERAVRLVRQLRKELGTRSRHDPAGRGAARYRHRVAARVGAAGRDRRRREAGGDDGGGGAGSSELEQENRELRRANEILQVGVGFLRGGARPPTEVIVGFIDEHRDEFGVEPICKVLADRSEHVLRRQVAAAPSARARARRGDDAGADGVVGRQPQGLRGAQAVEGGPPGRPRHRPGPGRPADARAGDRRRQPPAAQGVHHPAGSRRAAGAGPGEPQLHRRAARTRCGSPTSPTCRRGRGWPTCASSSTRSPGRSSAGGSPRTCAPRWSSTRSRWRAGHAAAAASSGSSPTPTPGRSSRRVRFTERLDEIGARPSIGTVADTYDNALAETTNGLYKTECVYGPDATRPGTTSTSSSSPRCRGCTGSTSTASTATAATSRPPSSKQRSTLPNRPTPPGLETNSPSLHQTQGGSRRAGPGVVAVGCTPTPCHT